MDSIEFATIFSVAFLGSLGHCIGMCGGFIVAYTTSKIGTQESRKNQFFCHLLYNTGRVISYMLLGAFFGLIGQVATFSHEAIGYLYFVIGIVMVFMGISLLGKIRFLTSLESSIALHPKVKLLFSFLMRSNNKNSFFFLGMLNGLLPCGLVYFFLVLALSQASWFWGMVTMGFFGVVTMPALLGFGFLVGAILQKIAFREIMVKISALIVIGYGIYMAYLGFMATQKHLLVN